MPFYLPGILEPCSALWCVERHTTSHNDQPKGEQFGHLGKDSRVGRSRDSRMCKRITMKMFCSLVVILVL